MKKILTLAVVCFLSAAMGFLSGCGTVRGVGQDVSKTGQVIQRAAS